MADYPKNPEEVARLITENEETLGDAYGVSHAGEQWDPKGGKMPPPPEENEAPDRMIEGDRVIIQHGKGEPHQIVQEPGVISMMSRHGVDIIMDEDGKPIRIPLDEWESAEWDGEKWTLIYHDDSIDWDAEDAAAEAEEGTPYDNQLNPWPMPDELDI